MGPWDNFKKALTTGVKVSFQDHDRVRKFACLFAGMNHMQPLLLATTNANYLLDRFCMERCCSSEYVSRIVTSIIFMEILATFIVAPTGIYIANRQSDKATGKTLNDHNEDEEKIRGIVGSGIQLIIFLGYFQILYAFTTGGKKGHMHWFYVSLILQYFVICLIAGGIGFWDVGHALWYLMAIPVGPIPVFFYQLMIHSWIRNHGPRDAEYLVVKWQIVLAITISCIATTYWIYGYVISYYPIELEIQNLSQGSPSSSDKGRIGDKSIDSATIVTLTGTLNGTVTGNGLSGVSATVNLTSYSLTLTKIPVKEPGASAPNKRFVTVALTGQTAMTVKLTASSGTLTGTSKTLTSKDIKLALNLGTGSPPTSNPELKVYSATANVQSNNPVTITTKSIKAEGTMTITSANNITEVIAIIPVAIKVTGASGPPVHNINSVILKLPVSTVSATNKTLTIGAPSYSGGTLNITVEATQAGGSGTEATLKTVTGKGFAPTKPGYCIYSIRDSAATKDIWANIGGKCEYVACYKNTNNANNALLCLYLRSGGSPERKYFGTEDAKQANDPWKTIPNEDCFIEKLKELATPGGRSFSLDQNTGTPTTQYNRVYKDAILNSPTWAPLVMHGMAVGSFGSIFPNLIPKTLTCPKTTRTLSVINMFLVPLPHIINLALADNGWPSWSPGNKWENWPGGLWPSLWLLYIFYIMALLFAIFNVHYPEWRLCGWIRNRTWFIFLMTLFTDVLNETFNAISRAGIMTQRSAKNGGQNKKLLNHPLLWNKMACLMSLSYIPFWMTTTPMMKSYVSSLDPFLCDKYSGRESWWYLAS